MLLLICIIVGIIIAENHFHKFYPNNYVLSQLLLYRYCTQLYTIIIRYFLRHNICATILQQKAIHKTRRSANLLTRFKLSRF